MAAEAVRIEGLAELRRALRRAEDGDRLREVRNALRSGAQLVVDDAQRRVPSKSGRARRSIRPGVSGNRALVIAARRSVPYYRWLDFGSRVPVSGRPRRIGPWKNSGRGPEGGRFLYPAIDAKTPEAVRRVTDALMEVMRRG